MLLETVIESKFEDNKMSSKKKRNPLNLSLPPTVNEEGGKDENTEPKQDTLDDQLRKLALSEPQIQRMHEWMNKKKQIGPLSEDVLERISELGHGNGGVVHKMRHKKSNIVLARKLVHLEVKPSVRNQILKELEVLHKCNSPYIVGFYGAFQDNNDISICMEFMDGLSLDIVLQTVGRIEEPIVGRIAVAVAKGLHYLKTEVNILHRDVKPSNILVNSRGEIKLCDFGVSGMLIDSMANSFVGTRSYMAPERLMGNHYTIKSDVWSFGFSLVEIATGRFPIPPLSKKEYSKLFNVPVEQIDPSYPDYESRSHIDDDDGPGSMAIFELLEYIVHNEPPTIPRGIFSDAFVEFVEKCFKKNLSERADLNDLMKEPFYKRYEANEESEFTKWVQKVISKQEQN